MALPLLKFVDKNLSFQDVFTDVYDGDLDVRVKCRVGFKKPGDAEPKDFFSVDLAANVGTIVNALGANFVEIEVLGEEPQAKAAKPLDAFDVLMTALTKCSFPRKHSICVPPIYFCILNLECNLLKIYFKSNGKRRILTRLNQMSKQPLKA